MAFEEQFVKEGRKDIGTDKQKQDQELFSGFLASGVAFHIHAVCHLLWGLVWARCDRRIVESQNVLCWKGPSKII